jgi:hypothetical protein
VWFNRGVAIPNWSDDPEIQAQLQERSVRNGLLRSAILWTPLFLVTFGCLVFFFIDQVTGGGRSTVFLLVVLAVLSFLFGFQAVQSILDLKAKPVTLRGEVTRRWSKMDSVVMRTHYIRIDKAILRGDRLLLDEVKEGDVVEVRYYKRSAVVLSLNVLERAPTVEAKQTRRLPFRK